MSPVIATLHTLEQLLRCGDPVASSHQAQIAALRAKVPEPVLAHFDRSLRAGRAGVALVRHGVCCACHIRVPSGDAHRLRHPTDIILCENCGAYLLLDPTEAPAASEPAPVVATTPKPAIRRAPRKREPLPAVA